MITGPGEPHARCVRCDALPRPSDEDADDRTPGPVEGPDDRALVGRRQALRASELADGILGSSGSQT
jgi:hypothetical protein